MNMHSNFAFIFFIQNRLKRKNVFQIGHLDQKFYDHFWVDDSAFIAIYRYIWKMRDTLAR